MTIRFDEKDIEDYLYENPNKIELYGNTVQEWVARQYRVPSGVIDLIGYMGQTVLTGPEPYEMPIFCVVELKNTMIDSNAIAQVLRYYYDFEEILTKSCERAGRLLYFAPSIYKAIVGNSKHIPNNVIFEANATEIELFNFNASFNLSIDGPFGWEKEDCHRIEEGYSACSKDFVKYFTEDVFEEFMDKLENKDRRGNES